MLHPEQAQGQQSVEKTPVRNLQQTQTLCGRLPQESQKGKNWGGQQKHNHIYF